jgi:hypothetical protein
MLFLTSRHLTQRINKKGYMQQAVLSSADENVDNEPFVSSGYRYCTHFVLFI